METIDDIVREMREHAKDGNFVSGYEVGRLADRFEKSYKDMVEGQNGGIVERDQYIEKLTEENERLKQALEPVLAVCPFSFETHFFKGVSWVTPVYNLKLCEAAVLEAQRIWKEGKK